MDGLTEYGFEWGPATVERATTFDYYGKPYRVLELKTSTKTLNIYISPHGRSIRVFCEGKEWKPVHQPPL